MIFDCDGVLVDSERIGIAVFHRHLRKLGVEMTLDEAIRRFKGRSEKDCTLDIESITGYPLSPSFFTECLNETFLRFEEELQPIPGILPALDSISKKICVASSGMHAKMQVTLRVTGLLSRFEGRIFSSTEVPRGKPYPDLFVYAAHKMGVAPGQCLVVEDSVPGIIAARAAGMAVIGYADLTEREDLEKAGAHEIISHMDALPQSIAGIESVLANTGRSSA